MFEKPEFKVGDTIVSTVAGDNNEKFKVIRFGRNEFHIDNCTLQSLSTGNNYTFAVFLLTQFRKVYPQYNRMWDTLNG